jgi:hypothetical protein
VAREVEATDDVLGDTDAVRRFLTTPCPRFGGRLVADPQGGRRLRAAPGRAADAAGRGAFPFRAEARVVLDRAADPALPYLGRTHPAVEALADAVLGQAFEGGGEQPLFSRAGAVLTRAVERVTAIVLLRLRYTFDEAGSAAFAEEVRLVAVERRDGGLAIVEPAATAALELAGRAAPAGNLEPALKSGYVGEMLGLLDDHPAWWSRSWTRAGPRSRRRTGGCGG